MKKRGRRRVGSAEEKAEEGWGGRDGTAKEEEGEGEVQALERDNNNNNDNRSDNNNNIVSELDQNTSTRCLEQGQRRWREMIGVSLVTRWVIAWCMYRVG